MDKFRRIFGAVCIVLTVAIVISCGIIILVTGTITKEYAGFAVLSTIVIGGIGAGMLIE